MLIQNKRKISDRDTNTPEATKKQRVNSKVITISYGKFSFFEKISHQQYILIINPSHSNFRPHQ